MKNRSFAIILAIVALVLVVTAWVRVASHDKPVEQTGTDTLVTTPAPASFNESISDGTIIVSYPGDAYGLATNKTQILVHAYIPPCGEDFIYCLYATSTLYKGTNFESAGLRIQKRADLATERLCLNDPPEGYDSTIKPIASTTAAQHSSSKFAPIGDAGAGHYASGSLYRLFTRSGNSCYELETRIGETQFANYPAGTKKEFLSADRDAVNAQFKEILAHITLQSGATNLFAF